MKHRYDENSIADQAEIDHEGETPKNCLPHVFMHDGKALWRLADIDDLIGNGIDEVIAQAFAPIIIPNCSVN